MTGSRTQDLYESPASEVSKALPDYWYNVAIDLGVPLPEALHPTQDRPARAADFSWLWPKECLSIELREDIYKTSTRIQIPEPVLDIYRKYRPTPLVRATTLERELSTPANIYFKREDLNPGGSHKFNTALAQAWYAANEGTCTLVTDTGAGQWGTALALACRRFGLECVVFMLHKSYTDKAQRRIMMELAGARVISSPSVVTSIGRTAQANSDLASGSLGLGMSEAIDYVRDHPGARLALGCMAYYAAMHQTVIGLEALTQMKQLDIKPDVMIGCVGGGSNFTGFIAPFLSIKAEESPPKFVAVEPAAVPCLTEGEYRYDWADYGKFTPRVAMYTLGSDFVPPPIHSGGLRYHGKTPLLSALVQTGVVEPRAYRQAEVFEAGRLFYECEGILPAPESAHAVLGAIHEARQARLRGESRNIVFCLSGHGHFDLQGYEDEILFTR